MSDSCINLGFGPIPRLPDGAHDRRPLAAFADGPVADTAQPIAAEAGIVGAEPDRDDAHTMGHCESMRA